jgi:hypothetical protein
MGHDEMTMDEEGKDLPLFGGKTEAECHSLGDPPANLAVVFLVPLPEVVDEQR